MNNEQQKARHNWVQLELFPEMKATKGGGKQSVTNQNDTAKWKWNFAVLAYPTILTMKHRATELVALRIVRYASAGRVA